MTASLTFARRERGTTHWIEGEFSADDRPDELFTDLEAAGWKLDFELPPYTLDGVRTVSFSVAGPKGTDLFAGWTTDEKRSFMPQARAILRKHGFHKVPVWKKTLADML